MAKMGITDLRNDLIFITLSNATGNGQNLEL